MFDQAILAKIFVFPLKKHAFQFKIRLHFSIYLRNRSREFMVFYPAIMGLSVLRKVFFFLKSVLLTPGYKVALLPDPCKSER